MILPVSPRLTICFICPQYQGFIGTVFQFVESLTPISFHVLTPYAPVRECGHCCHPFQQPAMPAFCVIRCAFDGTCLPRTEFRPRIPQRHLTRLRGQQAPRSLSDSLSVPALCVSSCFLTERPVRHFDVAWSGESSVVSGVEVRMCYARRNDAGNLPAHVADGIQFATLECPYNRHQFIRCERVVSGTAHAWNLQLLHFPPFEEKV